MTKAGPAIMKWALFQSGQIGRRYDPQLAWPYYREMVHNGKKPQANHGAVMSHIGAQDIGGVAVRTNPYELRDVPGQTNHLDDARKLIAVKVSGSRKR